MGNQEKELISKPQKEYNKSVEYASRIILSMVTGNQDTIYGNVLNKNFIPNLPNNCCVEVLVLFKKITSLHNQYHHYLCT